MQRAQRRTLCYYSTAFPILQQLFFDNNHILNFLEKVVEMKGFSMKVPLLYGMICIVCLIYTSFG